MVRLFTAAAVLGSGLLVSATAEAKSARCFNSDDGHYSCDFRQFGGDGSFTITAPARPTYTVSLFARDAADGFVNYGDRNVPLPGTFYRSGSDRACWISDATQFAICAY
ncbi:hypothetical protein [Acuticoccus mangrovi]|uniref:Secreted protein n=1 Tax=Acuticoccus mangrovi TaxID=2796142 RepID=A0A934IPJ5_9HYPH|nr:hypothetical protein [Acuticoccus mangrovi]MBJ3775239.1 hypothetical protein [Acuticoccus mangrovi]